MLLQNQTKKDRRCPQQFSSPFLAFIFGWDDSLLEKLLSFHWLQRELGRLRLGVIFRRLTLDEITPVLALWDPSELLELSHRFKKVLTGLDHSEPHQLLQLRGMVTTACHLPSYRHGKHLSTDVTALRKSVSFLVSLSCTPSRSVLDGLKCTGLGTVVLILQLINLTVYSTFGALPFNL